MMPEVLPTPPPTIAPPSPPGGRSASVRRFLTWTWRVASVRLRFLIVLGLAFAVVAQWDLIRNGWDKITRAASGGDPTVQPVSADTEYFCPMDPGVLSDWPSKCPICNMALVRRPKGDATPLPDGVIARMQLSPYRLQLAGIGTTPVTYRPLALDIEGPGRATSGDEAEIDVFAREAANLAEGQRAEVVVAGGEPLSATVRAIHPRPDDGLASVRLALRTPPQPLHPGESLRGRIFIPMASVEPFRSMPADPPPIRPGERRRVYGCADHPEVVREKAGRCPKDEQLLVRRDLAENQRLRWWCPMHPEVTADEPGRRCDACGGMVLVARVVTFAPPGEVLAVPESAVIDTGRRRVVYVESMPGTFDGVEVDLGPRCGDAYPIVRGLEPGRRVVTSGAFLVDAETRLNAGVAAAYFGAARRDEAASPAPAPASDGEGLGPEDRALADRQKTCPVTGKPLGSMGTPVKVAVAGRTVFLCCEGCEGALRKDPGRYLDRPPGRRDPGAKAAP